MTINYLDLYTSARRKEGFSVASEHDATPYALAAVGTAEQAVAVREAEEAAARAAVEAAEAAVKATKATDYVAREQAIAPLRQLVPARERAEQAANDAREVLAQRRFGLVSAIAQRRKEIAEKHERLVEMTAELERQEGELKVFEERHLPQAPNGETTE